MIRLVFFAGRYIGGNIRLLFDIIEYAEENDIPGLFLLIDFEKAFDSISWNFLNNVSKFSILRNLFKNGLKRIITTLNLQSIREGIYLRCFA